MNYLIVRNKQFVLLGPMIWRQRMFQSIINDLFDDGDITQKYDIPPIAPESNYLDLGEGLEIFPVTSSNVPDHDTKYFELAGPYYTYKNNQASESYNVVARSLDQSKSILNGIVTNNRYIKEQAGIKLTIQGQEVTIDTARGSRDIFMQTYLAMSDTETINWKFPEAWIAVTKSDMGYIVTSGKNHIQGCFDWELEKHNEIMAATTVAELQEIVLE